MYNLINTFDSDRLAQLLSERRVTQIARRVGVTRAAVYHWSTGRSRPTKQHLMVLADALGVDYRELVKW